MGEDFKIRTFFNVVPCGIGDGKPVSYVYEGDDEAHVQARVNCTCHGPMPSSMTDDFIQHRGETITTVMQSAAREMRAKLTT